LDEHCISVPFTVRPIAPCGEQNDPGWTPDLIAGRGACVVLFGVGFGVRLTTTLRGVGFTRVLVGVGVTVTVTVLVAVTVGVGASATAAVAVGAGAADRVADEQPAVSVIATTAAARRERILEPFRVGS
jgi:hypothetical protein